MSLWFSHEDLSRFLLIGRITDLLQSLKIWFFAQADPRGFVNSNVKTSPPSSKKDWDSSSGSADLYPFREPTFLMVTIPDRELLPSPFFTCRYKWERHCIIVLTEVIPNVLCSTLLKVIKWPIGLLDHLADSWNSCTNTPNRSVQAIIVPDSCILFHLPMHHCSRSLRRLLVKNSLRDLSVPFQVASSGMDLWTSRRANEIEDVYRLWGLHSLESFVSMASECTVLLIYFWVFRFGNDSIETCDCKPCLGLLLVKVTRFSNRSSHIRRNQTWTWIKTHS